MQIQDIFQEYQNLIKQADSLFAKVKGNFPSEVKCAQGCSDCCHAVFDLSLVEAMNLNRAFLDCFSYGAARSTILDTAEQADRLAARYKRNFFNMSKQGKTNEDIFALASHIRIRCPLLDSDQNCLLYAQRPITCRLYGVPGVINGKAHVCGLCAFEPGKSYQAIALDRIQDRLADLSRWLGQALGSHFSQLGTIYVPVSMALITKYDAKYLGKVKAAGQA